MAWSIVETEPGGFFGDSSYWKMILELSQSVTFDKTAFLSKFLE